MSPKFQDDTIETPATVQDLAVEITAPDTPEESALRARILATVWDEFYANH
jgi:hypothetical protein